MGNSNQKPKHDDQQEEEETFTCEICIEPVTLPNNKFNNNNKCVHPFCTECMIKYIQVKLEDNQPDITCPAIRCKHSLEPFSCRPKIPNQLFDKWCDALCESSVLGVDRVYCPNIECMELILNECDDLNTERCVCPHCKKPFCFKCKVAWHDGSRCGETGDKNDVAFGVLYKKKKWRRCPGCGYCAEHVGGCNMVRCRCGTLYCYNSGKRLVRDADADTRGAALISIFFMSFMIIVLGICMLVG